MCAFKQLILTIGLQFLPRIDQFAAEALGDATAQRDSWCLHLLGVSNKFKGRGIGTVMIQVVQKEVRRLVFLYNVIFWLIAHP